MSEPSHSLLNEILLFAVILFPITFLLIGYVVMEIISIPRSIRNIKRINQILDRIPENRIVHFLSFYLDKAKQVEPSLSKESLLLNIPPKNSNDKFWESALLDCKFDSAELIIDKYFSHEKYSHQRQREQKLEKCFIPE
jgi:hypothetical protein